LWLPVVLHLEARDDALALKMSRYINQCPSNAYRGDVQSGSFGAMASTLPPASHNSDCVVLLLNDGWAYKMSVTASLSSNDLPSLGTLYNSSSTDLRSTLSHDEDEFSSPLLCSRFVVTAELGPWRYDDFE
jgi:hypothetical protein